MMADKAAAVLRGSLHVKLKPGLVTKLARLYVHDSLVTRTGYFLVCSCAARRSGLVFIEIAYSLLLLSLKSIWIEKWNHRFT